MKRTHHFNLATATLFLEEEKTNAISSQGWVATLKYYSGVDFAKVSDFMLVWVLKITMPYYQQLDLDILSFEGEGHC